MAQRLGKGEESVLEQIFPGHLDIFLSNAIRAGEDSIPSIETALNECDFAIVLVTETNKEEPWLQYELGALRRPTRNGEPRIVPILLLGDLRTGQLPSTFSGKQWRNGSEAAGFLEVLQSLRKALNDYKAKNGYGSAPSEKHVHDRFVELWPEIENLNKELSKVKDSKVKDPQLQLLEEVAADIAQLKINLGTSAFLAGAREKARRAEFRKDVASLVGGEENVGKFEVAGQDLYALHIKIPETDEVSRSVQEAFTRHFSGDGIDLLIIDPYFFGPPNADADADFEQEYV